MGQQLYQPNKKGRRVFSPTKNRQNPARVPNKFWFVPKDSMDLIVKKNKRKKNKEGERKKKGTGRKAKQTKKIAKEAIMEELGE